MLCRSHRTGSSDAAVATGARCNKINYGSDIVGTNRNLRRRGAPNLGLEITSVRSADEEPMKWYGAGL
jgi:hypothetical protein